MTTDLSRELKAMVQLEAGLNVLEPDELKRVLAWAGSRFGVDIKPPGGARGIAAEEKEQGEDSPKTDDQSYGDLATFYDAASPSTDAEKILVCAYWLQYHENSADVDAQTVNTRLKHLGHQVGNVTRGFNAAKSVKPALLVQTRKEGSTKQARKKFKVTAEGRKAVERMLTGA